MAITYPRTGLESLVGFAPQSRPFFLEARVETSRTAGGETLARELGPALWRFDLRTAPLDRRQAMAAQAWLQSLDGPVRTLRLADPSRLAPAADTGASLDGAQIREVSNGALALRGLPFGFSVTPGDLLAFDWGTGRRALHEVSEAATANINGNTPLFEVRPHVRGAPAVGTPVVLVRPRAVWTLDPDSVREETVQTFHTRFSWTATQAP